MYAVTNPSAPGVGGFPRATPYFIFPCENSVRHVTPCICNKQPSSCCEKVMKPGANVPDVWLDGGDGWVTSYFTDVQPYDVFTMKPGVHRCQFPNCSYAVQNTDCLKCCNGAFYTARTVVPEMIEHVKTVHGVKPPAKRP